MKTVYDLIRLALLPGDRRRIAPANTHSTKQRLALVPIPPIKLASLGENLVRALHFRNVYLQFYDFSVT